MKQFIYNMLDQIEAEQLMIEEITDEIHFYYMYNEIHMHLTNALFCSCNIVSFTEGYSTLYNNNMKQANKSLKLAIKCYEQLHYSYIEELYEYLTPEEFDIIADFKENLNNYMKSRHEHTNQYIPYIVSFKGIIHDNLEKVTQDPFQDMANSLDKEVIDEFNDYLIRAPNSIIPKTIEYLHAVYLCNQ